MTWSTSIEMKQLMEPANLFADHLFLNFNQNSCKTFSSAVWNSRKNKHPIIITSRKER